MPKTDLTIQQGERPNFPVLEEKVLDYWDEVGAFEKSVEQRPIDKPFVFYDGPPFATGLPHYGHLLGSVMKDIVPRYWTMKGYRVERVWGWDCHGLPIENIVEQELDLKHGKKDIEKLGIDKFNQACRDAIWRFDTEWEKVIRRIGRWVDFKNSYKTMDTSFMESVWWGFKQLYDKGLVYQGRKVILYCPRCSTPLSNFEIAMDNSYKQVVDNSLIVKFPVKNAEDEFVLAWTTTPWTLIGNVALAVNPSETYVQVRVDNETLILAKKRLEVLGDGYELVDEFLGKVLVGKEYVPLYDYLDIGDTKAFYIAAADFVSMDEGTGVVHTAAMYGEDDFELAKEIDLPLVDMLDDQGKFMDFVSPLAGQFFKKAEDWIINDLESKNQIFKVEKFEHSYPFCYRCDTPLYYTGVPAWFVDIQQLKPTLVANNQPINWFPDHLKQGRFGKGLETAPDWNISRSRYWGTPMPIWSDESGEHIRVIGSLAELQEWAVDPTQVDGLNDIHREYVDEIDVWVDDDKSVQGKRIPEVFDCWVESGSMPFASEHYPFEHKARFQNRHPAQFISEYIAQTRAWFYTLHVMSTALFGTHTFENALTTGTIMAEDGTKMSKSKRNFTDPMILVDRYGVDALRLYFASSPLMKTAENVNFSEKNVDDIRKKVLNIFWNVMSFYRLYDDGQQDFSFPKDPNHVLDKWLVSKMREVSLTVIDAMDSYDVVTASRTLMDFVNEFSTWWLRLSRDRIRDEKSNAQALRVFRATLLRWLLLMAPFAPFMTELLYQQLVVDKKESIHLELLPTIDEIKQAEGHPELESKMDEVRKVVEKTHAVRKEKGIKLRQPLSSLQVSSPVSSPQQNLLDVLAMEVNVKEVTWKKSEGLEVELDTTITPELEEEGEAREIIRTIQQARRKAGTKMDEMVLVALPSWPTSYEEEIKQKVLASELIQGEKVEILQKSD